MKPSKRNLANAEAKAAKLKAGPPRFSKYERKNMTPEQLREAELRLSGQSHACVVAK